MKNQLISEITRQMIPFLDNAQMEQLQNVLQHALWSVQITANEDGVQQRDRETNAELLDMFLSAKRVEGCSEKTLRYYETSIRRLFAAVDCHVTHMQTDDLRGYLSDFQQQTQCSKGNIDNIRRIMSSFFTWLEDENYILKSPVRRIHKIRSNKTVKETYTDEALETMRDQCGCLRDLAILTFDACFPDSVVGFVPGGEVSAIYMHYWFGFFQKILEEQAPQVAQKNINLKILSDLDVMVPTKECQEQFATFVEQTDKSKYYSSLSYQYYHLAANIYRQEWMTCRTSHS